MKQNGQLASSLYMTCILSHQQSFAIFGEKWLLAYCLEYAYAKMWKEWSNVGLQDAKNASSASCCIARCALRKTKQARGKPLKLCTLPSLPQTLPKHSPASCYLWMHRRSSKWELEAMSFVQQQWNLHRIKVLGPPSASVGYDQEVAALSSARRCRTVRAWKRV